MPSPLGPMEEVMPADARSNMRAALLLGVVAKLKRFFFSKKQAPFTLPYEGYFIGIT